MHNKEWSYTLAFDIGDKVRYKPNKYSKSQGIVIGLSIRHGGSISYEVAWDDMADRWHYEPELELICES